MSKPFVHLRLKSPLVVLDIETTGVSPKVDRIVEVAAVKFLPDGQRVRFCRRINPGMLIPPTATAVHGITDQDVVDCPLFAAVAACLARFLRDADLAGFHIKRFDLPFLLSEFNRSGVSFSLSRRAVIDVLEIYHHHQPRDLAAAVRHYLGRLHEQAHSAQADAYATAAVLDAQIATHQLPQSVAEIHDLFKGADVAGRLRIEGERFILTFGKYLGRDLDEITAQDPDYLRWVLGQDFLPDFHELVRNALDRA
ncbi:hypothetical protein AYO44_12095 [Planctomycetaceae bacterium SCGC AG-212-F19]|nr:hypothetical protein AYO44_12095 [Planctomycetaceae bacterium SCGC AG-212-F19]